MRKFWCTARVREREGERERERKRRRDATAKNLTQIDSINFLTEHEALLWQNSHWRPRQIGFRSYCPVHRQNLHPMPRLGTDWSPIWWHSRSGCSTRLISTLGPRKQTSNSSLNQHTSEAPLPNLIDKSSLNYHFLIKMSFICKRCKRYSRALKRMGNLTTSIHQEPTLSHHGRKVRQFLTPTQLRVFIHRGTQFGLEVLRTY